MTLATRTIDAVRSAFSRNQTYPSEAMWEGITDIAVHLEKMAGGTLERKVYLSRLDPGVGKTSTATEFIKILLASPEHTDTAVLYCVSTKDEISNLVSDLPDVGVFTADPDVNKLGTKEPSQTRVLLTTQQMVNSRLSGVSAFSDLSEFHYLGKPREIRIWDEALTVAEELTLNVKTLAALPDALARLYPGLDEYIFPIISDIKSVKDRRT
jgi:hypothetical protein